MAKQDKPSIFQSLAAVVAGIMAVKVATYLVATLWRLVTREEPPDIGEPGPVGKKAAWVGLVGAASGAARQAARDFIRPPGEFEETDN